MLVAFAAAMLTSGFAYAQSLSVGIAVEFVERIVLELPRPAAGDQSTAVAAVGTPATQRYAIGIAATPHRELSIYASMPDSARSTHFAGLACEYANQRSASCGEISLTAVTLANGTLSVSPVANEPFGSIDAVAVIDVTIAHH